MGPLGSGSFNQMHGSWSFHNQAKIVRKTLTSVVLNLVIFNSTLSTKHWYFRPEDNVFTHILFFLCMFAKNLWLVSCLKAVIYSFYTFLRKQRFMYIHLSVWRKWTGFPIFSTNVTKSLVAIFVVNLQLYNENMI